MHTEIQNTKLLFQLDAFLQRAIRRKKLQKAYRGLFKNFLILLPQETHEELESSYLKVQRDIGFAIKTENKDTPELALKLPLSFPMWDQYILGGTHLNVPPKKTIIPVREDYRKKKLFRHEMPMIRHRRRSEKLRDD